MEPITTILKIEKANPAHAAAIHGLIAETLNSYGLYHLRPTYVDEDIDDINKHYFNNKGFFWIGKNEFGNLIATVAIYKVEEEVCELRKMYLKVQQHGNGFGKQLLAIAIAKAKELGYNKMILKTNGQLTKAIQLYENYGFKHFPIAEEDKKADCDVAMQLPL